MEHPYSITDLERHSGIKAHTIRMWERRYGIITPLRDEKNIRHYTEADLQRLVKIGRLCQEGHRISMLASMSHTELDTFHERTFLLAGSDSVMVDKVIEALLSSQERLLYELLDERFHTLGPRAFTTEVWQVIQERLGVIILSGMMHKLHLRHLDQIAEHLLESMNLKLMRDKLLCVGSALLINSCGNSSAFNHYVTKHVMISAGYDVVGLTLCQSDWIGLESILTLRKFDKLCIHYQAHAFNSPPPFDTITPWLPDGCEVVIYGDIQDSQELPDGWQFLSAEEVIDTVPQVGQSSSS